MRRVFASLAMVSVFALCGCAAHVGSGFKPVKLPVIKVGEVVELLPGVGIVSGPALSPDGDRLVVLVEKYRDPVVPYEIGSLMVAEKSAGGVWGEPAIALEGVYRPVLGTMATPVQGSFDETGTQLVLTQIHFFSGLRIPWIPTIRSWVERIPWRGGKAERLVERHDWGLNPRELIQHARISPDGRWLVFYTREYAETQGVYLLDRKTGLHYRLGTEMDKHPTWSPDGTRIYFHTVRGGRRRRFDLFPDGVERSVIGFFDLRFEGDRLVSWDRRLMDEFGDRYIYQKHPAEVPGTGLLFFHGQLKPEGKKRLMVRLAEVGSQVYVIKAKWRGRSLKEAKHPCTSFRGRDVVFVGKERGDDRYRLVLSLSDEALDAIGGVLLPVE
jgi:WD40-like Beta Propeller Repeat